MIMSKRSIVRLVSFSTAILLILSVLSLSSLSRAKSAERKLEYQYLNSINNLNNYLENIETALTKSMYAGTPATMANMTSKLWRESGFAKASLSGLPMEELNLEKTYKFLSQLGDYSVSLSRKMSKGEEITEEERKNLSGFKDFTDKFLSEILVLEDGIRTGTISLKRVTGNLKKENIAAENTSITAGFTDFESGFTAFPSLIYDGPFSDHLLQKSPEMLKTGEEISVDAAKKIAMKATGLDDASLTNDGDENGNMPSYCFKGENVAVGVTKKNGYISYFVKNREISDKKVEISDCLSAANNYLIEQGIRDTKQTYYEISDNKITINYAHNENEVTCYTDLIKVSVALDNCEILSLDARGYLTNHKPREGLSPAISQDEAKQALSPLLKVNGVSIALIPDEGLNEVLCYEFKCSSETDENILVYVNAQTGTEQQILVLYIDENGTLTL